MGAEITKAVVSVMQSVKKLAKDDRNAHGNYKYVSVDDVKEHIRPLMASAGLDLVVREVDWGTETTISRDQKGNEKTTLNIRLVFELFLRHTSGEVDEPERASIMLPFTGAQTSGAAKSYIIKEWIKGRFLLSTGEKDADADEQMEHSKPISSGASKNQDARDRYTMLVTELRKASTTSALREWKELRQSEIDKLPDDWFAKFKEDYTAHRDELAAKGA